MRLDTPMPFSTVTLTTSGIAVANSGWSQYGHRYGHSVKSMASGKSVTRGVYACANSTARRRSSRPAPCSKMFSVGSSVAVDTSDCFTEAGFTVCESAFLETRRSEPHTDARRQGAHGATQQRRQRQRRTPAGIALASSTAAPATTGDATDVPERWRQPPSMRGPKSFSAASYTRHG